jgi:TPR repeat protein
MSVAAVIALTASRAAADPATVCAPASASWARVSDGTDVGAMSAAIASIPAVCADLLQRARARRAAVETAARPAPRPSGPSPGRDAVELEFWDSIKSSTNPADYQAYLAKYPNGQFASLARLRAEAPSPAPPSPSSVAQDDQNGAAAFDNKDYVKAVNWYFLAARQDDVTGERVLGNLYEKGLGVPQDYGKALDWFRKAANHADARSENDIGHFYAHGWGVTQDLAVALSWYMKAALQGDAEAEIHVGDAYARGAGVAVDYPQAMSWYQKAAAKSSAEAEFDIANLYRLGEGVPVDRVQARRWFSRAAQDGSTNAASWLAQHPN